MLSFPVGYYPRSPSLVVVRRFAIGKVNDPMQVVVGIRTFICSNPHLYPPLLPVFIVASGANIDRYIIISLTAEFTLCAVQLLILTIPVK